MSDINIENWRVTQSFIKEVHRYRMQGQCGIPVISKFYLDYWPDQDSIASRAGTYFEFLCTGAIPKSGKIPKPDKAYKGQSNERLRIEFQIAQNQASLFSQTKDNRGLKIIESNTVKRTIKAKGEFDLLMEYANPKTEEEKRALIVGDLKFTTLIDDRWSEFGYDTDSIVFKDTLMVQPTHYTWIAKQLYPERDVWFEFWLFSSKVEGDAKIIRVNLQDVTLERHEELVNSLYEEYATDDFVKKFRPRPEYRKCNQCYLYDNCNYKHTFPQPIDIEY